MNIKQCLGQLANILADEGQIWRRRGQTSHLKLPQGAPTSPNLTLVEMVDADLGISVSPGGGRRLGILRNTRARMYPMRDRPHRTIGLAWRKGSTRVEEFALLGDFMKHNR